MKLLMIASDRAMDTVYYNTHGQDFNDYVKLPRNGVMDSYMR
jgi:hypothetical protein